MGPEVSPACADISGVVVHADPRCLARLSRALGSIEGVTVHAVDAAGKIVATIEADSAARAIERFEAIRALEGVLSVALAHHQFETNPDQEV